MKKKKAEVYLYRGYKVEEKPMIDGSTEFTVRNVRGNCGKFTLSDEKIARKDRYLDEVIRIYLMDSKEKQKHA